METLKVYTCNLAWRGSIVVIEKSEEAARNLMQNYENYQCVISNGVLPTVKEFNIENGFIHCNYGDL